MVAQVLMRRVAQIMQPLIQPEEATTATTQPHGLTTLVRIITIMAAEMAVVQVPLQAIPAHLHITAAEVRTATIMLVPGRVHKATRLLRMAIAMVGAVTNSLSKAINSQVIVHQVAVSNNNHSLATAHQAAALVPQVRVAVVSQAVVAVVTPVVVAVVVPVNRNIVFS